MPAVLQWEQVKSQTMIQVGTKSFHPGEVFRAAVPGGWLVVNAYSWEVARDRNPINGMVFVPDPEHQWK